MMGSMMQDLAFAIPGVDEAMSFAEIMKYVTSPLSSPFSCLTALPVRIGVQACQIHGIFCDRFRHGPNRTHATLSFLPKCARKGAGEAFDAEWAYRTHDQSGAHRVRICLEALLHFQVDVFDDGRPSGLYRRHVLEARINACGDHRSEHAI